MFLSLVTPVMPGATHADKVARCFLRHNGAAGFQVKRALCHSQPSNFVSPESVRELRRWDKTNYQLDDKIGEKKE